MRKAALYIPLFLAVCVCCACNAQHTRRGAAAQTARKVQTPSEQPAQAAQTAPKESLRGVWIASVSNIDYPSKPALSEKKQKEDFIKILDEVKALGFNTVVVQVRPTADTFWPSSLEPCSFYLSGRQGKCPSYDALAFMIEQTHKRGMQFHAWFNPFRVAQNPKIKMYPKHPALQNRQWAVKYGNELYYNPANKQAREHSIAVITEVVKKYPIDAVHLDDYFYPYPVTKKNKTVPFPDAKEYKAYLSAGGKLSLGDWRRGNVNTFVGDLSREIKKINPKMPFGISPFGIWRNKDKDKSGSATKAFSSYDSGLYADTRLWIERGWIDYVVPQLYWENAHKTASFKVLLDWWSKEITRNKNVKLYIGLAAHKHGNPWNKKELQTQLEQIKKTKNIDGVIFFSAKPIIENQSGVQKIIRKEFL